MHDENEDVSRMIGRTRDHPPSYFPWLHAVYRGVGKRRVRTQEVKSAPHGSIAG
jgi:hypothetical protein